MSEILKGLKGHDWEQALLITYPRARGYPRVVNDKDNINTIFAHRPDMPRGSVEEIKAFLLAEYNLSASKRNILAALKLERDLETERTIKRIVEQHSRKPFPQETSVLKLLESDLAWVDSGSRLWIVAEALDRLGYVRRKVMDGMRWVRKA